MSRMKTFFIYGLMVVAFYFFSNAMIYLSVNGMYKPIAGNIETEQPKVEVKESKATKMNGYLDGTVTNDTGENIENKYVKMDFFSERGVNVGTKYVKIDHLSPNESLDFHMGHRFKNSYRYAISVVDEIAADVTEEQFLSQNITPYLFLTGLIMLWFI